MPVERLTIANACMKKLKTQEMTTHQMAKVMNACVKNPQNASGMASFLETRYQPY